MHQSNNCKSNFSCNVNQVNLGYSNIEYFGKLQLEYKQIEDMADADFDNALKQLKEAIILLEDGMLNNNQGQGLAKQISKWLQNYGAKYGIAYKDGNCKKIDKQISKIIGIQNKLEEEALLYSQRAYERLCESRQLETELTQLQDKYMKCILRDS